MNFLVISLFVSIFAVEYFVRQLGVVPPYFVLLPEALSAVAALAVLAHVVAGKGWLLDRRYGIFLALYLFVVAFGLIAQAVPSGAVVAGLRAYVKYLPFFLLPAFYPFTGRQLKVQLGVLLTILAIQSPLAVYQRFVQFADRMHTGDPVRGMTASSNVLTLLMMCAIVLVIGLYLRRQLRFSLMVAAVGMLLLPTMLNETKSTLIFLPIALLLPPLFMPNGSGALRRLLPVLAVGSVAALSFITVYDHLAQHRQDAQSIEDFFLDERGINHYLYSGASEGDQGRIRRVDSIVLAVKQLSKEPLTLAFGLGAGNVSKSFLPGFDGKYAAYFDRYGIDRSQVTGFLWEIGVVGLLIYFLFYFFIWQDARLLARSGGERALMGQIWATVVVLSGISLFYNNLLSINETAYLFWFYSGLVASTATLHRRRARKTRHRAQRAASWAAVPRSAPTDGAAVT